MIGIAQAREIGNAAALRSYASGEVAPGKLDRVELEQFIRNGLVTFWHQCGTAKMGRDGMSVVDSALKVYGVEGLRVADGSVLPRVTTGNTMAPCVVIGERAAACCKTSTVLRRWRRWQSDLRRLWCGKNRARCARA